MPANATDLATRAIFDKRLDYSRAKLDELRRRLRNNPALKAYEGLTVYAAGSYARGEASKHSDIDLFLLHDDEGHGPIDEPRLKAIRVLSAIIREVEDEMDFPAPSNDGQFLNIIPVTSIKEHLGGAEDDYKNNFTARMLLLLESVPVYGADQYDSCLEIIVDSYMRDYENHASDFRATFLVNDILRFWKTLCLNYEHRRNQESEARKAKQKIKNFKLKYSRLLTCFASVAALATYNANQKEQIIELCRLRPMERLRARLQTC